MTTIEDLYRWAVEKGKEKLPIGLQFQDDGGFYNGNTWCDFRSDIATKVETFGGSEYILLE